MYPYGSERSTVCQDKTHRRVLASMTALITSGGLGAPIVVAVKCCYMCQCGLTAVTRLTLGFASYEKAQEVMERVMREGSAELSRQSERVLWRG